MTNPSPEVRDFVVTKLLILANAIGNEGQTSAMIRKAANLPVQEEDTNEQAARLIYGIALALANNAISVTPAAPSAPPAPAEPTPEAQA